MAVAVVTGLLVLGLLALVDAVAGPADCVSDLVATTCSDDPGPSRGTSVVTSLVAAAAAGVLRWRAVRARRRPQR